jgi:hypothetical protein
MEDIDKHFSCPCNKGINCFLHVPQGLEGRCSTENPFLISLKLWYFFGSSHLDKKLPSSIFGKFRAPYLS